MTKNAWSFEVGTVHFFKFWAPCKKKRFEVGLVPKGWAVIHTNARTHARGSKHTDSSCTFPMKGFQQVAVIRGRDRARVSEDSQQALRRQGAIWKPRPHVQLPLWYCLPADWRHRGVFNEHCSPAGCLKVGLSIHSLLMTLCITGRLLTERSEPNGGTSQYRLSFFFYQITIKCAK